MSLSVVLTGTFRKPELRFEFPWGAKMPKGGDAAKWIKSAVPGRRWDPDEKAWYITGTGINPDIFFARYGLEVDYSEATGDLEGLDSLEPLWRPMVMRSRNFPHSAFVRPRLAGYDRVRGILGPGAVWDKNLKRFTVQITDLIDGDRPKRGMHFDDETFNDAVAALQTGSIPAHVREAARELAASTGVDGDEQKELSARTVELIDIVASHTGYLPKWFGLDLFPFQVAGAYAIVGGHRALCDSPGLGKCVVPETRILANGAYTPIGQLWDERTAVTEPRPDYDGVGEIIELQPGQLTVQALNDDANLARTTSASHLYREHISAPVKTIRTASGAEITATLPHKFLTLDGWASEIHVGDMIAVPGSGGDDSVRWTKVTSVEYSDYDGWVYDLTVPDGHNYIAEGLWCHNTRQALAAAAIRRAERVVIVVPPLVVTNWCREALTALGKFYAPDHRTASVASLDLTAGKKKTRKKAPEFPPYIVPIRAGKKVPEFPDRGVIVVADSLLASRPELLKDLIRWSPDTALFDEVHRARNFSSGRATADRNLACSMDDMRVPITGTPFLSNPAEVTNLLAIGGLLDKYFGGASKFLDRYTKQDRFGSFRPKRDMLPELERRMTRDCWVRRNKADVLKQLPQKLRTTRIVDIDPRGFHEAHEVLYEKIREWVKECTRNGDVIGDEDIKKFASERIDLITPLRAAAGVAKVPAAIEIVTDWMEQTTETAKDGTKTYTRPLVVWVHHQPVMEALVNAVPPDLAGVGFIDGGTPEHKRQPMADKLQNGEIGVLFCSIGAAGFGITLTKSSDAIFVETDWTPANISQAEDRIHRIGQTETCIITTLMAVNTLDPHMRAILRNKAKDLNVLMPGADNNVTEMTANLNEDEGVYEETSGDDPELEKQFKSLGDIMKRIVEDIVREQNAGVRKRR
ncbi:SNF2-related protein [Arthrobacter caoxuetaonis]|uniref:ATP-dependent helicase n=1 Tax=Arthrobacter caoxuetaonis TaxID=2886935 RepID=A0A9X1MIC5_9MICC|nr:SNF2-related protein [Arthrobacter caoxuetaonis]MCC3299467.1 ATP-dependent helicase [Arthrobacter caoxuetaonis]USQ59041.1 SNF2-related protein [Arthrobacter caoxuetaonis]